MIGSSEHPARVCLIIPCFNEASRLDLNSFRDFITRHENVRLVFVDDGSSDNTRQVLETLCDAAQNRTTVVGLNRNGGKAEAVRAGVEYALRSFQPEIVGYWDADLATPLRAVDEFVKVLDDNGQILMVFGARVKLLGRHVERHATRHYLGRVFATVVSNMLRLDIYDSQCGAKLFRVDAALRATFAEPFLSKWVFDVEILARYLKFLHGDRHALANAIYEYPLQQWVDVAGSKVHPGDFLKAFVDIVRIKRRYL